jgi:hypothetical protein
MGDNKFYNIKGESRHRQQSNVVDENDGPWFDNWFLRQLYLPTGDMSSLSAGGGGQILKAQFIQCYLVSFLIASLSTSLL